MRARHGPTVNWCGIPVSRLWRCGNRGNVASVLIEKPARGDFRPIIDGGYSLQYSPLMEYRDGRGMMLFCQVDVTGRSETDPAAERLASNLLQYVSTWKPAPSRTAVYAGDAAGKKHLERSGIAVRDYAQPLSANEVLILGPGGGHALANDAAAVAAWSKSSGHLLSLGLDGKELNVLLPVKIATQPGEHIAAYFEPAGQSSILSGLGPADVHNRDPRMLPLVTSGVSIIGDGVLATSESQNIVLCQLQPWTFDPQQQNTKKTFRRSSFLVSRLLANLGVAGSTPIVKCFHTPVDKSSEQRWLEGLYLDTPEEWDDPYRFFRW